MTVVTHTLVNEVDEPLSGVYTEIRLLAPNPESYAATGAAQIISRKVLRTDSDGFWSLDLVPTSDIVPSGTQYEVVHRITGWPDTPIRFTVPDSGPVSLTELVTEVPVAISTEPGVYQRTITISPSEIENMSDTPIEMVAAPGEGKFVNVLSVTTEVRLGATNWYAPPGSGSSSFMAYGTSEPTVNSNISPTAGGAFGYMITGQLDGLNTDLLVVESSGFNFWVVKSGISTFIVNADVCANQALFLTHNWGTSNGHPGPLPAGPIVSSTGAAGGSGYAEGDTGTVSTPATGADATYTVLGVDGGSVTSYQIDDAGAGFFPGAWGTNASTGEGSGFSVEVLTVSDSDTLARMTIKYEIIDILPGSIL